MIPETFLLLSSSNVDYKSKMMNLFFTTLDIEKNSAKNTGITGSKLKLTESISKQSLDFDLKLVTTSYKDASGKMGTMEESYPIFQIEVNLTKTKMLESANVTDARGTIDFLVEVSGYGSGNVHISKPSRKLLDIESLQELAKSFFSANFTVIMIVLVVIVAIIIGSLIYCRKKGKSIQDIYADVKNKIKKKKTEVGEDLNIELKEKLIGDDGEPALTKSDSKKKKKDEEMKNWLES